MNILKLAERVAQKARALRGERVASAPGVEPVVPPRERGWDLEGPGISQTTGGYRPLQEAAERYARDAGIPYNPERRFVEVDPDFARQIAEAYARMEHAPLDPRVREAYAALIEETMGQYEALRRAGFKFDFMPEGRDIYGNPRKAVQDLIQTKSMKVFPTESGFGSNAAFDPSGNPLLMRTGEKWGGKDVTVNDVFRAVHDAFGHAKQGVGFRARGEENAFRQHLDMFSDKAARALASETRGQNSWLNFGPYGERNRRAKVEDTIFADQKTGIMPDEFVFGRTNREKKR